MADRVYVCGCIIKVTEEKKGINAWHCANRGESSVNSLYFEGKDGRVCVRVCTCVCLNTSGTRAGKAKQTTLQNYLCTTTWSGILCRCCESSRGIIFQMVWKRFLGFFLWIGTVFALFTSRAKCHNCTRSQTAISKMKFWGPWSRWPNSSAWSGAGISRSSPAPPPLRGERLSVSLLTPEAANVQVVRL